MLMLLLIVVAIGVVIGAVWLIARRSTAPSPAERAAALESTQHAARVAHIQQWESANADAHNGERPPVGSMPPVAAPAYGAPYSSGTNMMAILALVFGLGGGLLGIVFGYIGAGILVIILIAWVVAIASGSNNYGYE